MTDAELEAELMSPERQAKLHPVYRGMCEVCERPMDPTFDHVPCAVAMLRRRAEDHWRSR